MTKAIECEWTQSSLLTYSGSAKATFNNPEGTIEGTAHIQFSDFGKFSLSLVPESITSDSQNTIFEFLMNKQQKPRLNSYVEIELKNKDLPGEIKLKENLYYGLSFVKDPTKLKFDNINELIFSSTVYTEVAKVAYLIIPLLNFTPGSWQSSPPKKFSSVMQEYSQCLPFNLNGRNYCIYAVKNYSSLEQELIGSKKNSDITSFIFGEIKLDNNTDSFEYIKKDILPIIPFLGLASGTVVQAPFVELRDNDLNLVKRLHNNFIELNFCKGHKVIPAFHIRSENDGIANLISKVNSNLIKKETIYEYKILIRYLIYIGLSKSTLEDRLNYLFRALDYLCKLHKVDRQNLTDGLEPSDIDTIKKILKTASDDINNIAKNTSKESINTIADRTQNTPLGKDKKFGVALIDLTKIEIFDLKDYKIVNLFYYQTYGKKWTDVISMYRGAVVHEGYLDFQNTNYEFTEALVLQQHLYDIFIRIFLKIIKYDGIYNSPITRTKTKFKEKLPDWVKVNTTLEELGYDRITEYET